MVPLTKLSRLEMFLFKYGQNHTIRPSNIDKVPIRKSVQYSDSLHPLLLLLLLFLQLVKERRIHVNVARGSLRILIRLTRHWSNRGWLTVPKPPQRVSVHLRVVAVVTGRRGDCAGVYERFSRR